MSIWEIVFFGFVTGLLFFIIFLVTCLSVAAKWWYITSKKQIHNMNKIDTGSIISKE